MNGRFVFDASIAVKWFFKEAGSEKALILQAALDRQELEIFIPQLFYFEVANVIKTKPKSSSQEVREAIKILFALPFVAIQTDETLLRKSSFYAQRYQLSVYDAAYVALAKLKKVTLLTADRKLARKANLKFVKTLNQMEF
ncbi:type II toxin-antitoxin system VapC family toxin [Patescibacteria group bacterium]